MNFSLFKTSKNLVFITLLMLGVSACKKSEQTAGADAGNIRQFPELAQFFSEQSMSLDALEVSDSLIIYEGDMVFDRKEIECKIARGCNSMPDELQSDGSVILQTTDRQQFITESVLSNAVANSMISNVRIKLGTGWNQYFSVWDGILNDAIYQINSNPNSKVRFLKVSPGASADVVVNCVSTLAYYVPGQAALPSNGGSPGSWIKINYNIVYQEAPYFKRRSVLIHEMLHTVGFRHTDSNDGSFIPNSATASQDPHSIMNMAYSSSQNYLSDADRFSMTVVYPEVLNTPVLNSATKIAGGKVRLNVSNPYPAYIEKPYYWVEAIKYNAAGTQELGRSQIRATHNGSGTLNFDWGGHTPGTYRFKVKGLNFRRDFGSGVSPAKTVTL